MSGLLTGPAFTAQFPEIDTTPTGNGSPKLQGTVVAIYEVRPMRRGTEQTDGPGS